MKIVWRAIRRRGCCWPAPGCPPAPRCDDDIRPRLPALSETERLASSPSARFSDDEKPSMFDALDVFAMPSVAESFGIAYLEAWMCRKAVIGSRIGSTECVIHDGVDGVLVDARRPRGPRAVHPASA